MPITQGRKKRKKAAFLFHSCFYVSLFVSFLLFRFKWFHYSFGRLQRPSLQKNSGIICESIPESRKSFTPLSHTSSSFSTAYSYPSADTGPSCLMIIKHLQRLHNKPPLSLSDSGRRRDRSPMADRPGTRFLFLPYLPLPFPEAGSACITSASPARSFEQRIQIRSQKLRISLTFPGQP